MHFSHKTIQTRVKVLCCVLSGYVVLNWPFSIWCKTNIKSQLKDLIGKETAKEIQQIFTTRIWMTKESGYIIKNSWLVARRPCLFTLDTRTHPDAHHIIRVSQSCYRSVGAVRCTDTILYDHHVTTSLTHGRLTTQQTITQSRPKQEDTMAHVDKDAISQAYEDIRNDDCDANW
jgi:hypothetical protein